MVRTNQIFRLLFVADDDDDDAVDSSVTLCLLRELAVTALPVRSTGDFTMPSGNLDGREIRDG